MSLFSLNRSVFAARCEALPILVCLTLVTGGPAIAQTTPKRVVFNPDDFPDEPFGANPQWVTVAKGLGHVEGPTWNPDAGGFLFNLSDRCGTRSEEKNCPIPDFHWLWRPGESTIKPYWSVTKDGNGGTNHGAIWSEGLIYLTNRGPGRIGSIDPSRSPMKETDLTRSGPYKLGRPNDLDRFKDGSLYFSDGPGGIGGVHRLHMDGRMEKVISSSANGIAFSVDCKTLWVAADGIDAYDVDDKGALSNKRDPIGSGSNGIAVDIKGNVYTNNGGLSVFNPSGRLIADLNPPGGIGNTVNMTFGGEDHRWLLLTHGDGVSAVRTQIPGGECLGLGTQRPDGSTSGVGGLERQVHTEGVSLSALAERKIRITIPRLEKGEIDARLSMRDIKGKTVFEMPIRGMKAGTHDFDLDGPTQGGLYFIHFHSPEYRVTVKHFHVR
jgi:sugar lactone lactonase YvrE